MGVRIDQVKTYLEGPAGWWCFSDYWTIDSRPQVGAVITAHNQHDLLVLEDVRPGLALHLRMAAWQAADLRDAINAFLADVKHHAGGDADEDWAPTRPDGI